MTTPYTAEDLAVFDVADDNKLRRIGVNPDASPAEIMRQIDEAAEKLKRGESLKWFSRDTH